MKVIKFPIITVGGLLMGIAFAKSNIIIGIIGLATSIFGVYNLTCSQNLNKTKEDKNNGT